jgi:hypothetical protein
VFTPVPPGWVLMTSGTPYDVVGWTAEHHPVVSIPNRGIVVYPHEFGEDPYTLITERTYIREFE